MNKGKFVDLHNHSQKSDGKLSYDALIEKAIHTVILFKDPEKLKFLASRKMDRRGYVNAIRDALAKCGVEIPDYDGLKTVYPETEHLGRKHIADWMYKNGMVDSVDSAPFRSGYGGLETLGEIRKAGSDYHGQSETDGLDNHFPMEIWEKIEENYRRYFKEN